MVLLLIIILLAVLAGWVSVAAGWRFAAQRFGGAILVVILVTFATSLLLRQVPGEPCEIALGTAATEEAVAECVAEQGLDDPVVVQYASWAKRIIVDQDLGFAFYKNKEPLTTTITQRLPRTAWLFLYSQLLALLLAVPLGIWSAYQAGRRPRPIPAWLLPVILALMLGIGITQGWATMSLLAVALAVPTFVFHLFRGGPSGDSTVNFTAFVLLSIPVFVIGEALRYEFAVKRDYYQLRGYKPWSDGVGAHLGSIWLPTVVLGLAATPVYLRLLRADMMQNLQQDFVAVAKAKGMSNTHILLRHVLRPSTVTLMTVLGLNIAQLVNGAIVVEFIFDFDGMGGYLLEAVYRQEFFAVQTLVALVAVIFVLTNMVIDVLYTMVDPRVRAAAAS